MKSSNPLNLKFLMWGALWGIAEATLGFLLHLIPVPGVAGFIMFPIGFYFMWKSYADTESHSAVLMTAVTAALIKCVDFAVPGILPFRVLNPAVAIILEGLFAFALIRQLGPDREIKPVKMVLILFAVSFLWRVAFLGYHGVLRIATDATTLFDRGFAQVMKFLLFESTVNAIILSFAIKLSDRTSNPKRERGLSFNSARNAFIVPIVLFIVATATEYFLARV